MIFYDCQGLPVCEVPSVREEDFLKAVDEWNAMMATLNYVRFSLEFLFEGDIQSSKALKMYMKDIMEKVEHTVDCIESRVS